MGNYISTTGKIGVVVTVQPYDDNKARKTITLADVDVTVDGLRNKIIETFGERPDSALLIYYQILVNPSARQSRYLLSKNADLLSIIMDVENAKQKKVLFEYNESFVVTIRDNSAGQPDIVVQLEKADIMTELRDMIAAHFGVGTNICIYYQHSETEAKAIISNEKSLKLALINSDQVFFETLDKHEYTTQSNSSSLDETKLSVIGRRETKSHKDSGVFVSYNWSTKAHVIGVVDKLRELRPELPIWIDTEKMESNIYDSMGSGISGCQAVVVCFSMGYLESPNCMLELEFAQDLRKPIIPVFFFEENEDVTSLRQKYSKAFLIIAGKLYSDFKRMNPLDSKWEPAFNSFVKELDCILNKVPSVVVAQSPLEMWLQPESFDNDLKAYAEEYVPGTRKWIVPALEAWTLTKERVLYLNGGAGTGESLIVYSLTKNLPSKFVIGALFICRYNNVRKSSPTVLVSTIVSSLCLSLGGVFKQNVEVEMEADLARVKEGKQSILKSPVEAFKILVVDSLKKVSLPETLLIIIDALDELNKDTRHYVLTILTELCPQLPGFVKIITTGRPERDIYFTLQALSPFVLSPNDNNNKTDLEMFVKDRFEKLWGVFCKGSEAELCCNALVEKAEGLFIYARNVCEYIKKHKLVPKEAFTEIQALTSGSDSIYRAIIERELQANRAERLARFKNVFAVLFTVQKPLALTSLANIGGLKLSEVETIVTEFRPILKIEAGGVVSAIHKSVKDYFTNVNRCGTELFIQVLDAKLAVGCIKILISNLSYNMGNLNLAKFYKEDELGQLNVLNEDVQYAVLFWELHLRLGLQSASVNDQREMIMLLHKFCCQSLPYFLEALLLMTKLNNVFAMVQSVSDVLSSYIHWEEVCTVLLLLNDLKCVAINFRTQLLASPLQAYNHALIGVPQETLYYSFYHHLASASISVGAKKDWGPITLVRHSEYVTSVAFSPDSTTVVSGAYDNTVKLCSVETGELLQTLEGHSAFVNAVAFSADSKTVVSGSSDKTIKLWYVKTGECLKTLEGHSMDVYSVAFSPDAKTVVSGSEDSTVKLWVVETGECLKTFYGHSKDVTCVDYSFDSQTVASGSRDNTIKLWSVETGHCLKTFEGHSYPVRSIAFSPDCMNIASGSSDWTVKLWSVETGECLQSLEGHSDIVWSVAFSPDSQTVISGSEDKTLKMWSVELGECLKTLEGHSKCVNSVAFSHDSKTVVSGSNDRRVILWSTETKECSRNIETHSKPVLVLVLTPDTKTVVSGSSDRSVKLWCSETGKCFKTLEGHTQEVSSLAIFSDSKTVISGSGDMTLKLWSIESGECLKTFEGHSHCVTSVALSPDSMTVVSGSWDRTVKLWSVETGQCLKTMKGHSDTVWSVAFSHDSKMVVSGSKNVKLWDLETGECLKTFKDHTMSVAFLNDSKTVASGSLDDVIKLWSVETGECIKTCPWDRREVTGFITSGSLCEQDGWICQQDRGYLYYCGTETDSYCNISISWCISNDVFCLVLKDTIID